MSLLVREPIGYDYSQVTLALFGFECATVAELAEEVGLTANHTRILLNCAEADGMVERTPYAGKNRGDLWRLK